MDFKLTKEQIKLQQKARDFALNEILPVMNYFDENDTMPVFLIKKANDAVVNAKKPVPPDAELTALNQQKEQLAKAIPDDPAVVQLRSDAEQSKKQLENIRLTAAEDLTWALINSPAFLFNH
jgi:hypothetical protein